EYKKVIIKQKISVMNKKPVAEWQEQTTDTEEFGPTKFTTTQKLVLLTFIASLGVFIFGALTLDWEIDDLVGIFLIMGVIVAFIARISPNRFITLFIEDRKSVV